MTELNINQTLFVVIFSLIAVIIVLSTYVCWLKRMKMRAKNDILAEQYRLERQQQQSNLSASQLQELKPVLLQKLYNIQPAPAYSNPFEDTPQYTPSSTTVIRDEHLLVNIRDDSERDATVIHTDLHNNTR
ncbi:uncharacterized protein BX663DRAFT_554816 [Cokeromyces recurvatus]|uniref:uncharacterized protein n=1 Tax=Cokeromyces recurvatus TaxID=90255 RepID=UPI00221EF678|nr:uncharacterized protein BX663DRAFT_554816 [Cokeromyces recurvatus]KAI7899640.1 hypothetical protein BX663DRAFT_554816 [Cokeromyces recurvatus]